MYASFDYLKRVIPATETMFIQPQFPMAGAAIDLWFAPSLYYGVNNAVVSALSISRASIGYAKTASGTLTQFAADTLRITNLGLLVEDSRTNVVFYSQQMSQGSEWFSIGVSATDNSAVAPDGTTTAALLTAAGGLTGLVALHGLVLTSGTVCTVSVYAKAGSGRWLMLFATDQSVNRAQAWFDLQNGVVGSMTAVGSTATDSSSIELMSDGWYRCTFSSHPTADLTLYGQLNIATADANENSTAGQTINAWGMQFEQATFASSYIPTTTTSATRAADNITIIGDAQTDIASATASIVVKTGNAEGAGFAANIVDSSGTNLLGFDATNHGLASITSTLTTANTANRGAATSDKLGIAWDGTGRSLVLNNGAVATDAVAQTPSSTQNLGSASGTSNFAFLYITRLTIWTSRLSDLVLKGFTEP